MKNPFFYNNYIIFYKAKKSKVKQEPKKEKKKREEEKPLQPKIQPPNKILFIENLPPDIPEMNLIILFRP